jgi:2-phospho-L-lactate guanylyltransferase
MTLWTVVPVKPFEEAKTRLAGALGAAQRCALAARLFDLALQTVLRFAQTRPVLVVTGSERIIRMAVDLGAQALLESAPDGLNAALRQAAAHVCRHGGSQLLAVATDLPLLEVEDLSALEASATQGYAIAPDVHLAGTNALLLPASAAPPFAFGPDSYAVHRAAIRKLGAEPGIVTRPGLALDIDRPEDLAAIARLRPALLATPAAADNALSNRYEGGLKRARSG